MAVIANRVLSIRLVESTDFDAVWEIFHSIVVQGETYAYSPDTSKEEAIALWINKPTATYVATDVSSDGQAILGTYYIKPNQPGLGAHVCNCGYMVAAFARGQGVATTMCHHSQAEAKRLGFRAMQFNCVVSTNTQAVRLWHKLGFETIGTLPGAFCHGRLGFVDAYVMYKQLQASVAQT